MVYWYGCIIIRSLKPIFHCNANPFTLGSRDDFALPIPTCWYLKILANPTRPLIYPTRPPIYPTRSPICPTFIYLPNANAVSGGIHAYHRYMYLQTWTHIKFISPKYKEGKRPTYFYCVDTCILVFGFYKWP